MQKLLRPLVLFLSLGLVAPVLFYWWNTRAQLFPMNLYVVPWFVFPPFVIALFDFLGRVKPNIFRLRYLVLGTIALFLGVSTLIYLSLKGAPDHGGLAAGALFIWGTAFIGVSFLLLTLYWLSSLFARYFDDASLIKCLIPVIVLEIALLLYSVSDFRKIHKVMSKCHSENLGHCVSAARMMLKEGQYEQAVKQLGQKCDHGSGKPAPRGSISPLSQLCYLVAEAYEKLGQHEEAKERIETGCEFDYLTSARCVGTDAQFRRLQSFAKYCNVERNGTWNPLCVEAAGLLKAQGDTSLSDEIRKTSRRHSPR